LRTVLTKRLIFAIGALVAIAGLTWYYVFDPVEMPLMPKCVFKSLTGYSCSGCGMQRFLHAMMHGRFIEAIHYNYLLVVFLPYITLFGIEFLVLTGETQKRWKRVLEGKEMTMFMFVLVVSWTIIRNILGI